MTRQTWADLIVAVTIALLSAVTFVGVTATPHSSTRQRPALCATTPKDTI